MYTGSAMEPKFRFRPKVERGTRDPGGYDVQRILNGAKRFAKGNRALDTLGTHEDISEVFYGDFYSVPDVKEYAAGSVETERVIQDYNHSVAELTDRLSPGPEAPKRGFAVRELGYWCYAYVSGRGGGLKTDEPIGRFYLNVKPPHTPAFFESALQSFAALGIKAHMKIPMRAGVAALNRADKMVIYFNEENEREALGVLEKLYHANPHVFDQNGIPKFTLNVRDRDGAVMTGVGFGEEPEKIAGEAASFGEVRSHILSTVYMEARAHRLDMDDPRFDFDSSFRRACERYHVDPALPAFNLDNDSLFREIRNREKQQQPPAGAARERHGYPPPDGARMVPRAVSFSGLISAIKQLGIFYDVDTGARVDTDALLSTLRVIEHAAASSANTDRLIGAVPNSFNMRSVVRRLIREMEQRPPVHAEGNSPEQSEGWAQLQGVSARISVEGLPADVRLADKHLQIIDVRSDPRWNTDYLLIDPSVFDAHDRSPVGYKGIREGDELIIGRDNPYRFTLTDRVSREHVSIHLHGNGILIKDLDSTNGTAVHAKAGALAIYGK